MNQLQHTKNYIDDFVIALSHNRKISLKYLLISLPVAVCLGTICFIGKGIDSELSLKICQLVTFAATGLFHLYLLKKKISFFRLRIFGEGIMYTLSMSVVICIALLVFYLFTDNTMALMAIASSAAFALPHIVLQTWVFFKNIPGKQYSLWTAPVKTPDNDEIIIPGEITVSFTFSGTGTNTGNKQETVIKTIPEQWKLGKVFYTILENEKNKITVQEPAGSEKLFGWEFYTEILKGLVKKRLEPEWSLTDNGIVPKTTIHVRKITATEFAEKSSSKVFFE